MVRYGKPETTKLLGSKSGYLVPHLHYQGRQRAKISLCAAVANCRSRGLRPSILTIGLVSDETENFDC